MDLGSSCISLLNLVGNADFRQLTRSLRASLTQDRNLCQIDFDVDPNTGFFPPQPLPKLPEPFSLWEQAMADAQGRLSLGDDESPEAISKRPAGERWRARVRSVSQHHEF